MCFPSILKGKKKFNGRNRHNIKKYDETRISKLILHQPSMEYGSQIKQICYKK